MESIELVPVVVRDHYKVIAEMMHALHLNERELFSGTDDWANICEPYMNHVIESQEDCEGTFLMAYVDKIPAGFIFGYMDEEGDERIEAYVGKDLYVSDGYIKPEYRRHGLYSRLSAELERIYIEKGVRRILRWTLTSNVRMQQLLAKKGFTPVRIFYEKWLTPDASGVLPLELTPPENGS